MDFEENVLGGGVDASDLSKVEDEIFRTLGFRFRGFLVGEVGLELLIENVCRAKEDERFNREDCEKERGASVADKSALAKLVAIFNGSP